MKIGQEVLCIESNDKGTIKVGQIFIIKDIKISECKCKRDMVDVGKDCPELKCNVCCEYLGSGTHWFWASRFIPVDELMSEQIEELKLELSAKNTFDENEQIYLHTKSNYKDNGIYEDNETDD